MSNSEDCPFRRLVAVAKQLIRSLRQDLDSNK